MNILIYNIDVKQQNRKFFTFSGDGPPGLLSDFVYITLLYYHVFSLLADCCLPVGKLHPADCWQTFSLLHTKGMQVPGCSYGIRRISWRYKERAICLIGKRDNFHLQNANTGTFLN